MLVLIIEAGQKIREWNLGDEIGRGAIGVIFSATHKFDEKTYAIKVLRPELSKIDELKQRFLREAKIATALKHENIVESYPAFEEAGRLFLPMEFLSGNSLKTLMVHCDQGWPCEVVRFYGAAIARGLFYAHKQGYAHRDVKPGNIFVSLDGLTVKVVDFGLALGEGCERLTATGTTVGTPNYLAPEVVDGERASPKSDIYALGVVLFRMVTNCLPFEIRAGSNSLAVACQMREQQELGLPKPSTIREDCPEDLDELIYAMLQFDPDNRPDSSNDVAKRLSADKSISPPAFACEPLEARRGRASTDDVVGINLSGGSRTIGARPSLVKGLPVRGDSFRNGGEVPTESDVQRAIRLNTSPTEVIRPPTNSETLTVSDAEPIVKAKLAPVHVALFVLSLALIVLGVSIYLFLS